MKKVYIPYDYNDEPSAVVLAENSREANIAFMAMRTPHSRVEEIDVANIGPQFDASPVLFLLTSEEKSTSDYARWATFRVWKRGL